MFQQLLSESLKGADLQCVQTKARQWKLTEKKCYITFVSSVTPVFFSLTSSAFLANALSGGTERMLQSSCQMFNGHRPQ